MKILLGVTGAISAYKAAEFLRLLKSEAFDVRVVMTRMAMKFVAPLTFQALSGHRVAVDLSNTESQNGMDHITLARWADFIVVVPASADFIARLAQGRSNDLLASLCLAATVPIAIAPSMNQAMWLNPATQRCLMSLKDRNILCFGPAEGEQACGEYGPGRLLEPKALLDLLKLQFQLSSLVNKKIMITAGPTQEAIDPIRYLTNHSTGEMGYALAEAAASAGASVTLVSGPTQLRSSKLINIIDVRSALEMRDAVLSKVQLFDIFIGAAAVCDYRPARYVSQKIKKSDSELTLTFLRNPDILSEVSALKKRPFTVGFAAETEHLLDYARSKLKAKKLDMIVANQVSSQAGFGSTPVSLTVLSRSGHSWSLPAQSKRRLAEALIRHMSDALLN